MEQLFAVRVLVHYYDKPKVDHAAVRKLLSAVDTLQLLLTDGTSTPISTYIQTDRLLRVPITDVLGPSDTSLVQVASVFMLAEARAAADALRSSPADLDTACVNLERLLACLATTRPILPVHDIHQSARVKLGTAARRRAIIRTTAHPASAADHFHQAPILKAVNAVLRLCDVATHCLAVVSRQTIAPRHICHTAVTLSTRLLTLAASLYDVQRRDPNPALSFSSSNSLRTALVSGAMYLGSIAIEHLDIEPMNWVHVANHIVISSTTSVPPRTSIMSALFAGMIKSAKDYEACDRDTMAARRAAMLLSTLHVVLETNMSRDSRDRHRDLDHHAASDASASRVSQESVGVDSGSVSQAARSFLGERVVAAEEDGDEARIAARTVYQACEEYAVRAGETEGVMGLLARLFASAGRQCRQEPVDETPMSISESPLNIPCPPDESDASSDSPHMRSEGQPFPIDVFDQRSRDGLATSPTAGTVPDDSLEPAERLQLHRQIGALALETLAHWVERTHLIHSYADLDIAKFGAKICSSAGMFSLTESPESYDMRAAMTDFGSLIGVTIENRLSELPAEARATKWRAIIIDLISTCERVNPILTGIVGCCRSPQLVASLLKVFFASGTSFDSDGGKDSPGSSGLPVGSVLSILFGAINRENAFVAVESLVLFLKERSTSQTLSPDAVSQSVACLMLLSHAALVHIGINEMADITRSAIASLYHSDVESHEAPVYPQKGVLSEAYHFGQLKPSESAEVQRKLVSSLELVPHIIGNLCGASSAVFTSLDPEPKNERSEPNEEQLLDMPKSRKLLYHFLWSVLMMERVVETLESNTRYRFNRVKVEFLASRPPVLSFFCLEAARAASVRDQAMEILQNRKRPSANALYISECLSLLFMRGSTSGTWDLLELLKSTVKNVTDITAGLVMKEVSQNFRSLLTAFQDGVNSESITSTSRRYMSTRGMFTLKDGSSSRVACLQLGMVYARVMGGDGLHELLTDAVRTTTSLVEAIPAKDLFKVKDIIFSLLEYLVFIPSSLSDLSEAIVGLTQKVLSSCFKHLPESSCQTNSVLTFISQVCGFASLVRVDSKSANAIQSLCKFSSDTVAESESELPALRFSLGCGDVPESFGSEVVTWLTKSLPHVVLPSMLAPLLVPADDSAVAVSSHAQSLSLLTTSCEISPYWHTCVFSGIKEIFLAPDSDFALQMVRRSVMQSATMNEGVVALFEKVVGGHSTTDAAQILLKCFNAAYELYQGADVPLESRIRLFSFCIRISIAYGKVFVLHNDVLEPPILEHKLFDLIFRSLEARDLTTRCAETNSEAQLVLFLCNILDSFFSGLYENYASFFGNIGSPGLGDAHAVLAPFDGDINGDEADTVDHVDHVPSSEEQETQKRCTYTTTGNQYVEQHWYYCYSCALDGSEGVCSVCARVCHEGCELTYSKFSRFFCDCGAGSDPRLEASSNPLSTEEGNAPSDVQGVHQKARQSRPKEPKPCLCMKPVKRAETKPPVKTKPVSGRRPPQSIDTQERDSLLNCSLRRALVHELSVLRANGVSEKSQDRYKLVKDAIETVSRTRDAAEKLLQTSLSLLRGNRPVDHHVVDSNENVSSAPVTDTGSTSTHDGRVVVSTKMARSTKLLKCSTAGSTGLTSVLKQSGPSSSLISYSSFKGIAAVATRSGEIELTDLSFLLATSESSHEKMLSSLLGKISVNFSPRHLAFHPDSSKALLVVGDKDIALGTRLNIDSDDQKWAFSNVFVEQTQLELFGETSSLVEAFWIDGCASLLVAVTEQRVMVFDVSVSGDISLPVFFAQLQLKQGEGDQPKIVSAAVWSDISQPPDVENFFMLVLTSDGKLCASYTPLNGGCTELDCLWDLTLFRTDAQAVTFNAMTLLRSLSAVLISLSDGSLIVVNVLRGSESEFSIRSVKCFKEATQSGPGTKLVWIPGTLATFISYQINRDLSSCVLLSLSPDHELQVQNVSGNGSSSVVGASTYAETTSFGQPVPCGALLLLDDGTIHKVETGDHQARGKLSEQSSVSSVLERQKLRATKFSEAQSETQVGYNPIPDAIGFFEKSRLVSEPVTIEGPRLESGITHERMAVMIAGEGGDCVVSQVSNEPFIFNASISNQSLVLVGARLRVGGTDRSRNRVPAEVKVFDRAVKWHGRNGLKRWIDIPFSVPESTTSPQKVKLELVPHRSSERGRSVPDGRVAIDCLELHAVSTIEFNERKILFEKERTTHMEKLKKKKELSTKEKRNRYPNLNSGIACDADIIQHQKFSQEQASAVTAVSAVSKENFILTPSAGDLLYEVNFLWVGSIDGVGFWDPRFLSCLLKACLGLDQDAAITEHEILPDVSERVTLLYDNARGVVKKSVGDVLSNGVQPSIHAVEKGLFSLGGMARVLINFGRKQDVDESTWLETCTKHFPSDDLALTLLKVHVRIGRAGRLLYRSVEHACTSATDIAVLLCLMNLLRKSDEKMNDEPSAILSQMLCNVDQRLRLLTAQRVIDLFDSLDSATDCIGSPFEDYMTAIILEPFSASTVSEMPLSSEPEFMEDDSDGTQRWAYRCDSCGNVCDSEWWHCMDCPDFDLCTECLRSGKRGKVTTHNEDHVLLRGTIEEEVGDPADIENPAELTTMTISLQGLFASLADSVLKRLIVESSTQWRFLDSVELFAQLVGLKSTPELREYRLEALSTSSIWTVAEELIQKLEDYLVTDGVRRNAQGFIHTCVSLSMILKVFLSGRGSSMPVHLHNNSLPLSLVRLTEKMRGLLAEVCGRVTLERNVGVQCTDDFGILSASVWNDSISGLIYDIFGTGSDMKKSKTKFQIFEVTENLPLVEVAALNVVADSIRVLEYAYRCVWSSSIINEMENLPQALLCDVINMCETAAVKVDDNKLFNNISLASRALLSTVSFDSDETLNNILDMYLYEDKSKKLHSILDTLGKGNFNVNYDVAVEIADIMDNLHKAALVHPSTWREYVIRNPSVIHALLSFAKCFDGSVQVQMLQLLGAGMSVSNQFSSRVLRGHPFLEFELANSISSAKPDDDTGGRPDVLSETTITKKSVSCSELVSLCQDEPQVCLGVVSDDDFALLVFLVRHVLLKSQTKKARRAASQAFVFAIVRGAADSDSEDIVEALNRTLSNGLEWMQFAGDLADGLMVCLRSFLACCHENLFGASSDSRLASLTAKITSYLKDRCRLLVSHPNARLYTRLSEIIDLPGYFLESEPCITCATSTWESSEFRDTRLDTVRAETKYTDSSIMYRLVAVHEVQTVSVKVIDPRRTRRVKKIDVLYSAKSIADGADLKSSEHPWKKLKTINLGPNAVEGSISMMIPVVAANVKLHFVDFHSLDSDNSSVSLDGNSTSSSLAGSRQGHSSRPSDSLQCPRCSRSVTDRHGICRNCHENAYQCRQCRNINYENLDGFLCNECGYCKHGRFEFSVLGRPTHFVETIRNEEDRKHASKMIERETSNVHRCMEQLVKLRTSIIKSLTLGIPSEDYREKSKVLSNARVGLADILDSSNPRSEIAVLEALLEGQVSHEMEDSSPSQHGSGVNIPEVILGEGQMNMENEREPSHRSGSSITSPIGRTTRADPTPKSQGSESSNVNRRTIALTSTYTKECRTIFATMSRGVRILTMTRAELVRYANSVGGDRLRYADEFSGSDENAEATNDPSVPELDDVLDKLRGLGTGTVCCYGCTQAFISKCVRLIQTISKQDGPASHIIKESNLSKEMLVVSSLCEKRWVRDDIRDLLTYLVNDNAHATQVVCKELQRKIGFCVDSYDTVDSHSVARFEMSILEATALLDDSCWEDRLRLVIRILFQASTDALTCSTVAENIILPCLRIALRLLRFDSELTVIESTSEVGNNVLDSVISEGLAEPSETEQEDGQATVDTASLTHSDTIPQDIVRPRISEAISSGALGDLQDVTLSTLGGNQGLIGFRDPTRADDRRSNHRVGSDLMVGSRAPSSIGTAFDGHMSDEDMEVSSDRTDQPININAVSSIMESDHDAKQVSANIGMWLDGRHNQASWINELVERSKSVDDRDKPSSFLDGGSISLQRSIFRKWKRVVAVSNNRDLSDEDQPTQEPLLHNLSIKKGNWIIRLMLFTPCAGVRKEACSLLEHLCCQEEALQLQLLDLLTGPSLSLGADVGDMSKEFFDLLESTLNVKAHRLYLIGRGFLPRLAAIIRTRAERLIQCEAEVESSMRLVNFTEGYSLKRLVALLRLTLEVAPLKRVAVRQKLLEGGSDKVVWSLQRAYICVKKLISLRTRLTDECASQLSEVLLSKDFLFSGSTVDSIVSACVSELQTAHRRNDAQAVAILLEELCLMLCPERSEPTCLLSLNKAPTQEEFIRGSMSRNPYPSPSFDGPLMRHVKNKICKDLDLPGLLQDDFTMELLVAGNVVKLDLPIMGVYEHIWRGSAAASMAAAIPPPHVSRTFGLRRTGHTGGTRGNGGSRGDGLRGTILSFRRVNSDRDNTDNGNRSEARSDPPMVVVYRLSGLDGEATEPIIDSLPSETNDDQDAEDLYGDTIVLGEVGGFDVLFQLLAVVGSWGDDAETAVRAPALRLLRCSCEVVQNRTLLAKSPNAVSTLLDCAASAFEHAQGSPAAVSSAESLLIAAEQILAQQRRELDKKSETIHDSVQVSSDDPAEVMSRVQTFLRQLEVATSPKAEYSILHLLPFLIQGVHGAIEAVLKQLLFDWDNLNTVPDEQRKAKQLATVLFATPQDLRGNSFVAETIQAGVAAKAVEFVINKFPMPKRENRDIWESAYEEESVPLVLRLLTGLCQFFGSPSKVSDLLRNIIEKSDAIVPVLCQVELAVSVNAIGSCAEEVVEAMARDEELKVTIDSERKSIMKGRREAAEASRMAILQETGLSASLESGGQEKSSSKMGDNTLLQMLDELEEEEGPECVVCGDGFQCRPEEALALYVFCRKMPLDLGAKSSGQGSGGDNSSGTNSSGGGGPGSGRLDWDLWASGRSRGIGGSSRSGANSCYTTVTHMNAIHLSCHRDAARMDRSSRRDEWDGAALRNSQTRCNNLLPIRPPVTVQDKSGDDSTTRAAAASYASAVEGYFGRLSALGRVSLSQSKTVVYDLGRGLLRFGNGGTSVFSEHSRGGGAHSNATLIPHMVQLGLHVIDERGDGRDGVEAGTLRAGLMSYLKGDESGDVTYYLALSVLLQSISEWVENMCELAKRVLQEKGLERAHALRLIAFVDVVQRNLKRGLSIQDGQSFTDALRRHVGRDETFAQTFGDDVNGCWEGDIRKIETNEQLLAAVRRNAEVIQSAGAGADEAMLVQLGQVVAEA